MDLEKIFQEYKFSDAEKQFIRDSGTPIPKDMNKSRIVSEFILGKKIMRSTTKIIQANKKLAISNDRHSKMIAYFTAALVFVGMIQIFIQIM